jgi:protein-disulfide isomerase
MSNDDSSNVPDPHGRRSAVREKAQQVHAQQRRARVIRRAALTVGGVVIVGVVAAGVTMAVASQAARPDLSPSNLVDDGFAVTSITGFAAERPTQPVEATPTPTPTRSPAAAGTSAPSPSPSATTAGAVDIRIYVDYYAPGAKQFQVANAQQLTRWVSQEAATLSYYPVAMLTPKSNGTKYSLRAASASACVATHSPDAFFAYNNALLTKQPEQGSDGFTDAQLADLAIASGADRPKVVRDCIEDEDYASWVKSATERALEGLPDTKGVALTATPMVLVNGTPYAGALDDPKEFAQFVLTLSSDAYYKSSTPSPTVTPAVPASPSPSPTKGK